MNIGEAVKALKEGKRVRRSHWREGNYLEIFEGHVFEYGESPSSPFFAEFGGMDVLAEDWEVAP